MVRCMTLRSAVVFLFLISSIPIQAQNWGSPVWQDEFNGAAGSAIETSKWTYDTGNLQVNNELEIYCAPSTATAPCDPANPNAFIDGAGHLVIQQRLSGTTWTSARLKTKGVKTFQYGRIEANLQIPSHAGLWPAFWMLGDNIDSVPWPACGEVDIMENWPGIGATKNATSMHGTGYSGGNSLTSQFTFPNGERVDTAFHTYGIIWSPNMMQFYFDDPGNITFVRTAADVPAGSTWPFNNPFFLIANMAVGGVLGGTPDAGTTNAGPALFDYIRYYQPMTIAGPTMAGSAITVNAGASGSTTVNLNSAIGNGLVYLACTNAPAKATCVVDSGNSLNSHVVDFSSNATATATIKVTTTANSAQAIPSHHYFAASSIGILGLFVLPFSLRTKPGSGDKICLSLALLVAVALTMAFPGCGGGTSNTGGGNNGGVTTGTPTGTTNLTITAYTISGDTSTVNVSLTVK
jgi:beta-glucanase (GH16 family)